ncbi:hypothetical protein E0Z10_g1845 [Xylaria hypoxylon]|uniref:Uncharacterized protein n=1 Tax=Xylaria hypoxylon TaxID=37992 RepID=A0A4Z0Z5H1_9PEZI|nr:hypothetical protein E0Z10_g1845 [Xylaria hypoxylon]
MPAKTPCAYTVNTTEVPGCGVWRTLQSLDNISSPKAQAQPAPSEELQIVRRGFEYAIGQLEGIAKAITAASNKKALKEQNLKNGAPYEKQAFEASEEEAKLGPPAMKVLKFYNVWGLMKDRFEQKEYGKSSAVEIPASTKAILGLEE